ncbi:MAG: VCBS repeat-containing protein, partial [Planctomycetota bacterium]|nr:VCBS repeat-containing protein [Planctomycetota bacterium]
MSPAADGWPSEELHDAAKKQLKIILTSFYNEGKFPDGVFATNFTGTPLIPADTEVIYQAPEMTVMEAAGVIASTRLSAKEWHAASFIKGNYFNDFFKIVSVDINDDFFGTHVIVHAPFGESPFLNQINQEFYARWDYPDEDSKYPLLTDVELYSYQLASTAKPLFTDVSASVFKDVPRHRQELLYGVDKHIGKTDRIIGNSLIGSQGIAVADVNGDGLDDIYLAQQGGLPNRLYLHQPDGSVVENSANARVDFLDNTRGVLLCDFDNDGDQDLAAAIGASILIAYNDGNGVFAQRTALRMNDPADIYSLTAGDPDNDGDLDIYACRYVLGG